MSVGTKISQAAPQVQELYRQASEARANAYSPYSGHKVGAAIRIIGGQVFTGCNVENSSYGATNCAERVAIQTAVAQKGKVEIIEVMVVTDANPPWPPCGMCRQVVSEFSKKDTVVYYANLKGDLKTIPLAEIFPQAFTPANLEQ